MSKRFAISAGAVIQFGHDGILRVICGCVPRDLPQSAVSGESWAIALLDLVLGRGALEDGLPHGECTITNWVDCTAIITAMSFWRAARPGGNFPYAGYFRGKHLNAVSRMAKVAAHKAECDAAREGWLAQWQGNDKADEYAKLALPLVDGFVGKWSKDRRRRMGLLGQLLESLTSSDFWADMRRLKPAVGRKSRL